MYSKKKSSKGTYVGRRRIPLFFFSILFFLPSFVFAYTQNVVCSDFTTGGGASCSADIWTLPAGSTAGGDPLPGAGTYYVSMDWVASGGHMCAQGGGTFYLDMESTGSYSAEPITSVGDTGFYLDNRSAFFSGCVSNTNSDEFTVGGLCISDSPTGCAPTPPSSATTTFNCVRENASSTECLIQVVNNPTQDIFNGIIIFLLGLFGTIWLFVIQRR